MSGELVEWEPGPLVPVGADKHTRYRLGKFTRWMAGQGRSWHEPDLAAYRDYLLQHHKAMTVQAHLSTVRARYQALADSNETRQALFAMATRQTGDFAGQKAIVDEVITRLRNAVDPRLSAVKVPTSQDRPDSAFLRLTREQAEELIAAPGTDTLQGLRDTAVIALLLCTGIREAELCSLDVPDLRQRLGGELALHVREGKGCKERTVVYGAVSWVVVVVEAWMQAAGIEGGAVFRGLYKGGRKLRPGRLSVRAVQYIASGYPIVVEGQMVTVRPHDLRRTYARRLAEDGVDLVAIQQNMGHRDQKTTLGYIGTLDASRRRAPAIYSFDLDKLLKQKGLDLRTQI